MLTLTDKQFEKLYNENVRLVSFIVSKYIGDPYECEEITNDVFVRLYQRSGEIKNLKYYIVSSAKNAAKNSLKKKGLITVPLDENAIDVYAEDRFYSDYRHTIEEMRKVLRDDEIEIILSSAVFDEKFASISKRLNKPMKTVYTTYMRAIKKYRKFKEGEDE